MGKQWKQWQTSFLGSKITADGDCSHEIKRRLLLGRKALTNLNSILKSRCYFANKGPSSQSYDFSSSHVWIWELDYKESWALKNWCFWTVVLEKTLESPLDCKEINPSSRKSVLSIHWKDWCWSWNSNTLSTWCEELTHGKRPWCWERLKAGGEGDNRGWDGWMAPPTWWTWIWASSGSWWWTEKPGMLQSMRLQSWTWLSNWTELRELAGNWEGILKLSSLIYWVVCVCVCVKPLKIMQNLLYVCMHYFG